MMSYKKVDIDHFGGPEVFNLKEFQNIPERKAMKPRN